MRNTHFSTQPCESAWEENLQKAQIASNCICFSLQTWRSLNSCYIQVRLWSWKNEFKNVLPSPPIWKRSLRSNTVMCGKQCILVGTMRSDVKLTELFHCVSGVLLFHFSSSRNSSLQIKMVSEDCASQNISTVKLGPFCFNFLNSVKENHTMFSDHWVNRNKEI